MDMYQKRKMRKEKREQNEEQNQNGTRTCISWYPGHMAKTKRQIEEDLKLIDIVVELLDSRIPLASQNPIIGQMIKGKKHIVVLNKCDLSDDIQNKKWVAYFEKRGIKAVLTDSQTGRGIDNCIRQIENMMGEYLQGYAEKGRTGRRIRAIILGIPNVGKSSFINRISKRAITGVGNKPGVTRQKQWIRINEKIELMDTPGVLWPRFESKEVALNLAFTGTIKEEILDRTEIAYELIKLLANNYKEKIVERFKIEESRINEILNQEQSENMNIYEIMQEIGKKRGCIMSGGNIDDEKNS